MPSTEFKFYLVSPNGQTSDVQRITAQHSGSSAPYLFVCRKIKELFPIIADQNFKIFWKDEDGDEISTNNDEGVAMATKYMSSSGAVKLYVKLVQSCNTGHVVGSNNERGPTQISTSAPKLAETCDTEHVGIVCDGCGMSPVVGYRFQCIKCVDYDLCAACKRNGVHSEHRFTRISTSTVKLDPTRQTVHIGIECDGCGMFPIVGYRFQCKECMDYDLCATCKTKGVYHQHRLTLCPNYV